MKRRYAFGAVLATLLLAAYFYLYGGSQTPSGQPPLQNVTRQSVAGIKNEFNAVQRKGRSEFCCFYRQLDQYVCRGASAFNHMMGELAGKPVRIFAVWEPVLFTDWSSPSTTTLARISNTRAAQFWTRTG